MLSDSGAQGLRQGPAGMAPSCWGFPTQHIWRLDWDEKGWAQQGLSTEAPEWGFSVWLLTVGQLCSQRVRLERLCSQGEQPKRIRWKAFMTQSHKWHSSPSAIFHWWKQSKPTQIDPKCHHEHSMIKLGRLFELPQQGYILPWGPQVDIARHCHHRLDVTGRKYQKPPKTVCTPELSREALADMRSQLCLDWYLDLEVFKAQSSAMVERGWVSALK